jgi:aspartyl-tRNA(Asn)/glutamyl-tRNA(Gln) amidotransferase subunit A
MNKDILKLTCRELRDSIAKGEVKSSDAILAVFAQIEKRDAKIGAFLSTFKEDALKRAREIDARIAQKQPVGALAGVPIAVKDNMCTTFGATTCASKILENFRSPYNATVIEKLLAADAVIIGKTNLDEFAMGSSTENSGLKKTVNPWDPSRVPGGSSGGSAAAVAAKMCFAALGSDTGGSIRQPASFCGIAGLKPTYGRVSRYGLVAYGSSLDQIGPLAKNTADCALLLNVIAGHDEKDSTSVDEKTAPLCDWLEKIEKSVTGLKIAVVPELFKGADSEVVDAIKGAIEVYKKLGAEIVEIKMPHFEYAIAAYYLIATAEASSNLARYDGVHYGYRTKNPADYVEVYTKSRNEALGAEVKRRIMLGTYALSSGYYDAYYGKAMAARRIISNEFKKAFDMAMSQP